MHLSYFSDPYALLAIGLALALGGILKGATGAGAPVIAIPVVAAFFDVRLAVVVMLMPNLITNLLQIFVYRNALLPQKFALIFGAGGAVGAWAGSVLLAKLSLDILSLIVAAGVFAYVGLRLAKPHLKLPFPIALRLSGPIGIVGGVLQGASGISAPAAISFLNAMQLERRQFIVTISIFFVMMVFAQIPTLFAYDILTWPSVLLSIAATVPLLVFLPVGSYLARSISPKTFDHILLGMLVALAAKLVFSALWPA